MAIKGGQIPWQRDGGTNCHFVDCPAKIGMVSCSANDIDSLYKVRLKECLPMLDNIGKPR